MTQLTLPSWQLEKTCIGYIDSRLAREQTTTNSDKWAILLLASTAMKSVWDRQNQKVSDVVDSWVDELHPDNKDVVDYIFSDNIRYRNITRTVFASVKPAGCYEASDLLIKIENGDIDISTRLNKTD